jgi:hypothetical protein
MKINITTLMFFALNFFLNYNFTIDFHLHSITLAGKIFTICIVRFIVSTMLYSIYSARASYHYSFLNAINNKKKLFIKKCKLFAIII